VTAGARPINVPARLGSALRVIRVPAVAAQDTLGAGDVLHGALCHELARHVELDRATFMAALTRAAEVAARSCTARGVLGWTRLAD
jgi:sugar/nucleoside kinase (ribokinase family)